MSEHHIALSPVQRLICGSSRAGIKQACRKMKTEFQHGQMCTGSKQVQYMEKEPPKHSGFSRLCLRATYAGTNYTGKLFPAHAEKHADGAAHHDNDQDTHASNKEERGTDVLLLARWPTPLKLLDSAVTFPHHCLLASASVTVAGRPLIASSIFQIAVPVSGAIVGRFSARRVRSMANRCEVRVSGQILCGSVKGIGGTQCGRR